jgi:hypothetical protein
MVDISSVRNFIKSRIRDMRYPSKKAILACGAILFSAVIFSRLKEP